MNTVNAVQQTRSPVDGSVYVSRACATAKQTAVALSTARAAQRRWRDTPLSSRIALCRSAMEIMQSRKEAMAREICWQMGRPIRHAGKEIDAMVERAEYMISIAEAGLAAVEIPGPSGLRRYIRREPLGVVLVIAPWNYPYLTAINSIVPALLAGNAVILKHSAQTPLCAERFAEAFTEAGLPGGVFQYLHLRNEDTEKIVSADEIDHICFTGSVAVGRKVARCAAAQFSGLGLELGGKDPAYVRADADIDRAVETVIDGALFNSGQSCCAIERLYLHHSIADEFMAKAIALVNRHLLGRPDLAQTTLGPLVHSEAANRVRQQIAQAVHCGAITHIDEQHFPASKPGTPYLAPQLLSNVDHSMAIMAEESFGPVLGAMQVKGDSEAIKLMNDSRFGLTAAVFTRDIDAAADLGRQIETGTFFANRCDYLDPALAWTGTKQSGRGYALSSLGYETLTRPKSFHLVGKQT